MNPRERVLTTLHGGKADRVPKEIQFSPQAANGPLKEFYLKSDGISPEEYYACEMRRVEIAPTRLKNDYLVYHPDLPDGSRMNEWGVAFAPSSEYGFWHSMPPMKDFTSVRQVEEYPFPDVAADYRYEEMAVRARDIRESGLASCAFINAHNYVAAWQLRGQETFMIDMVANPTMAAAIIDRTTEMSCEMVCQLVKAGADILFYGEDIASQKGLIMSPATWKEWLKDRLELVIDTAHRENPDVVFVYHSDGDVTEIISELVEVGIDVLNPLQPECMDLGKIKDNFGKQIAFWGGVSVQKTIPFGSPRDVELEVKERIETLGKDGGYLISPSHFIEQEVSLRNVEAFIDAVDKYGSYA